ncbi:hypothetical protein Nos7524_3551 [Nostoc sp. PCC 7524]|uniref:hypothetical protein n=1 Tax=Nostoc sp. (strain ATCC 29411 / PCC 7524) TaxID=28072 RepID=UPI00029F45C7|nr:hypothetical protein [Nostoc sp. PCC 7524]AFY49342.1 hypothetical protein Nos7524_3551 [Nostoc sp. PCC 7524]
MKSLSPVDPVFRKRFTQMTPEIKYSFTEEQLVAIERVFSSNPWTRNHPLDMRIAIPIPGMKFYMVLLAGSESRAKERLRAAKSLYPIWTPSNIIFLIVFAITLSLCSFSTFLFIANLFPSHPNFSSSPTSIPWIFEQSECEYTGRTWSEGKCWDKEHNSMF